MTRWIAGGTAAVVVAFVAITYLGIHDREIPRAALEAKYATPPSQFAVLADGTRVHYRDRGPRDAPVLVLLHGFSGSLFVWETWSVELSQPLADAPRNATHSRPGDLELQGGSYVLMETAAGNHGTGSIEQQMVEAFENARAFLSGYRVISLDLPGHGLTGAVPSGDYSQAAMTEMLKQFADRLGLKRFALAGNSMGGGVAARFAETYPDRVTHLILIDADGARTGTRPRLHLARLAAWTPLIDRWFLHALWSRTTELSHMQGTSRAMLAHFRLPDDPYVWLHAKQIRAPTLILWGGEDHTIPVASAYAWQKAIPGSKLIVYPHAQHVSMVDAPNSARDVRAFLAGEAGAKLGAKLGH
ncbi:MAG: alpha/beta hydrolase [Alphaproteobacteria bacterium]|nr:alpha/beta hydrolase [Alphaproteobacteria bacterium]